jgi:type IV secretory pathway VirB9-like protein
MRRSLLLVPLGLGALLAQPAHKAQKRVAAILSPVPDKPPVARSYVINDRQTVLVNTKIRYDTWIILPREEVITEAGMGDPDNWSVKAADEKHPTNILHVKPDQKDARTNLHLRTAAGHIYSFLLTEVSSCSSCQPDLKVFVDPPPEPIRLAFQAPAAEDHMQEIAQLKLEIGQLRDQARRAQSEARTKIDQETSAFRAQYLPALRCDYSYKFNRALFFVEAICSDGLFTYIKSGAEEMPSLYMERDGKPALVKFDYRSGPGPHQGTYIIDAVMTSGYLQLGRKKLKFRVRS